jgi:H+-transporting ATPase
VIAREIFQRIKNYLVYRVAVTYQLLMFFFLCIFAFQPKDYGYSDDNVHGGKLPDFFNLPVLALVIVVILNDFAIISIAYDHVVASAIPETWTLKVVFTIACWLGTVAVCGQMTLLSILLDHHNGDGFLSEFTYGQIMTAVWLTLSLLDFFSVLSARIAAGFFWQRMIGIPLLCAAIFAMTVSTILAATWPFNSASEGIKMEKLNGKQLAFIWAYCIGWFLVQDFSKRAIYQILLHFDFEGIRTAEELRIERAKALMGTPLAQRMDESENSIKMLTLKVEPIESLLYEVKLLQAEVSQLKASIAANK